MIEKELNVEEKRKPVFSIKFEEDGSEFELPEFYEDIFINHFGESVESYQEVEKRIHELVQKYIEHKAFPSKFDGILTSDKEQDPSYNCYDDPEFYGEAWSEWKATNNVETDPTSADIAEGVIYQNFRIEILQKTLNEMAERDGTTPVRVMSPEQVIEELKKNQNG